MNADQLRAAIEQLRADPSPRTVDGLLKGLALLAEALESSQHAIRQQSAALDEAHRIALLALDALRDDATPSERREAIAQIRAIVARWSEAS